MKLKRLVLQGYKTFASRTEFVFDDGITAIVGPNGSGKSNIADALRWVLGEQSYSMLRGRRTTDMIFAGSASRSRAGMAQVSLTLDNSDGWLPIDYTEVEIGRRASRAGENEYLLNGQKVRLKDVVDLLAQSGLSERTYTMIGQGLIDQALSLRAEERRALFEEAAGIMHYKNKRAETLRRLDDTIRNLQRVHDILAEIGPRLTSLKRQATRARNYEQVQNDLRHLLRIWYGFKWEQTKEKLRLARQTAVSTETVWQASRQSLLQYQDTMQALRQRINRHQQQLQDVQTERDAVRDELERARREVAILHERQQSLRRQLATLAQERPFLDQQQAAAAAELAAAADELAAAQDGLQGAQLALTRFTSSFQTQQAEISRWQQALQQAEQHQRQQLNRLAQAQGQLAQLQERLAEAETTDAAASAEAERTRLQQALDAAQADGSRLQQVAAAAEARAAELQAQRRELVERRRALIGTLKQLRRTAAEQAQEQTRRQKELARLETRVDMLAQLRLGAGQIDQAVPLLGQLAGFLTIPEADEAAVSAALAARLATLLLPDDAALWQLLDAAAGQAFTAAVPPSLRPPEPLPAPADPAVTGWAADRVTAAEPAGPLLRLLLGRVLLVRDARAAYRLARDLPPGALAVSPDGLVVHAGGLVDTSGRHGQDNILAREAAWRTAQADLERQHAAAAAAEASLTALNEQIQAQQNQADELQQEESRLGRLENEANQRVAQAQRSLDRAAQQQAAAAQQQQALARRAAEQQQAQARLAARVQTMQQELAALQAAVQAAETAVGDARAQLDALPVAEAGQQRLSLQQAIGTAQTIVAGRQAVVDSRRSTLQQVEQQLQRIVQRETDLQAQQAQLALNAELDAQTRLQAQLEQLEARLQPVRQRLADDRQAMRDQETSMAAVQRRTLELETQYTQAQVRLSQEESHVEGLQERIKADLGIVSLAYDDDQTGPTPLPIGDVVDRLPDVAELPDDIEETIHNYRGQLQRMGAINPDAPEEYESTQARHDFLTEQIEDLNDTERQLRAVIEELDELTSKAFAKTVEEVNEVFGKTFRQLFGGGSARLALTDPDDLTISGVDIIAQLPNRREQGLGLLSGGERSLTAAALIFSLLKVSPTPFCVMDEVDAALDEANVNRFRDLLRELSLNTQFVVITHNRGTVQAAQTIYGISMGGDSTSQSISIKPEEYVRQGSLL